MNPALKVLFTDPQRCIGCNACVAACAECETHRGRSMVQVDKVDERRSPQTVPTVCMHCEEPTCALVCPADAIKKDEDGVVHSSLRPRCIACRNCELSCPFGVPSIHLDIEQMLKCDLCYDRTSLGRKPMCATVCPTGALWYGTEAEIAALRPHSVAVHEFHFGRQVVRTRNAMLLPRESTALTLDPAGTVPTASEVAPGPAKEAEFL
jgi:Fe-S-cluster-containing dehydrogenase component